MSQLSIPPRLLVVEDDPVSAAFLRDALAALPAQVDLAGDISHAVQAVQEHGHALWLIDAHLPDGDGSQCLAALRCHAATPALAITAGAGADELDQLYAAGFLKVLMKPVTVDALHETVQQMLAGRVASSHEPWGKLPLWDAAHALAALGGNRDSLLALRKLFLAELPGLQQEVVAAAGRRDSAAMRATLHKLVAGCGFVGAARLGSAVQELAQTPMAEQAMKRFGFAVADVLAQGLVQP